MTTTMISSQPSALTIRASAGGESMLEIGFDGTITWNGPPSKAARLLLSSVRSVLDLDTIGDMAAERMYRRTVARMLRMARSMSQEEFIDRLEQELQARQSKAMLLELGKDDHDDHDGHRA